MDNSPLPDSTVLHNADEMSNRPKKAASEFRFGSRAEVKEESIYAAPSHSNQICPIHQSRLCRGREAVPHERRLRQIPITLGDTANSVPT